uniref:Putative BEL1-like homeodomain protein 9 n=1 Tax=Davidia involucrata TaxID=16924 RepID=A0A5B6YLW1_DAVIN
MIPRQLATTNSQSLLAHKDAAMVMMHQESPDTPMAADPIASNFSPPSKASGGGDPQNCSVWKSIGSQQSCDWIVNYSSGTASNNQNPMFVGEGLSGSLNMKPSYNGNYQDVQSSLTNPSSEISSQNSHKHYEEVHFNSPPLYPNTLQDVVTSATTSTSTQGLEMASIVQQNIRDAGRGSWEDGGGGNELLLLPSYANQSDLLRLNNAFARINRPVEGCHQWNGELGFLANKSERDLRTLMSDSNTQGLALSLSSVPPAKTHVAQFGEKSDSEHGHSRAGGVFGDIPDSKNLKSDYLCSEFEPTNVGTTKVFGNTRQDAAAAGSLAFAHRNTGPLGPFTGYATILKNSKFLKPAQQLLDEFCSATGPKSDKISKEVRVSAVAHVNAAEFGAKGGDSGVSSPTFYSSNEISGEVGAGSSSSESYRPEYQQKKARLLYMQEEVCRRYKQYHQQMQMVVSSFESVAGLTAATPYVSLALKTVSSHFRSLKNAISDQLRHIRKALGEDLSSPSPTTGTSSNKGDPTTARLKFIDHSFQKHKSGGGGGGGNLGFFEPQQHVWRPQRGLPERSVAILRAWLFEHFLHPYPTDTDKHMLATQTGLTRNQVSNWFINARVRVWKPMVEEIHSLETKGLGEANSNPGRNDGKPATVGASRPNDNQQLTNRLSINAMSNKQLECSEIGSLDGQSAEHWNQEKRSRVECQIPGSMDGSLMGFVPYHRSGGLEIGGLGAVSLTLGLRQSAESAQQQQLQQQQEHQLRQHFGSQMVHDFVG